MIRSIFIGGLVSAFVGSWASSSVAQPITLTTADEQSRAVVLQSLDANSVAVVTGGKVETMAWEQLSRIVFPNNSQTSPPSRVMLRDQSSVAVNGVELAPGGEQLNLDLRRQSPLVLPIASVSAIRFRPPSAATDPAWLGLLAQPARSDRLVARRNDNLETIEGPILSISKEAVSFSMSGSTIAAPLGKLEGAVFADVGESNVDASIRVRDAWGSVWQVRSITMPKGSESLQMILGVGSPHAIPMDQVLEIEVQGGILNLAAAEVASSGVLPSLGFSMTSVPLDVWFGPMIEDGAVTMDGPGEITFRIPPGYSRLVGAVRRPEEVNQVGRSNVMLALDEKEVWSMSTTDRETLGFDLPLGDARRVTLRMTANNDSSLGDAVEWIGTRLLK